MDPENNSVTAKATYNGGILPAFMLFDGQSFTIYPVRGVDFGSYNIQVILNDGY